MASVRRDRGAHPGPGTGGKPRPPAPRVSPREINIASRRWAAPQPPLQGAGAHAARLAAAVTPGIWHGVAAGHAPGRWEPGRRRASTWGRPQGGCCPPSGTGLGAHGPPQSKPETEDGESVLARACALLWVELRCTAGPRGPRPGRTNTPTQHGNLGPCGRAGPGPLAARRPRHRRRHAGPGGRHQSSSMGLLSS